MREYPFRPNNLGCICSSTYDVLYLPEVISFLDAAGQHGYNQTYNFINNSTPGIADGIIAGGTVDYFPYSQLNNNGCLNYPIPTQSDFYDPSAANSNLNLAIYSPPYSLLTALLRNSRGEVFSGYSNNSSSPAPMTPIVLLPDVPLVHSYFIDQNVNLNLINDVDKIIYNPSEVSVVADVSTGNYNNIVFPNDYTFKTITDRFPSVQQVTDANTADNGGPYTDLRDVPVPVDAGVSGDVVNPEICWDDPRTTTVDERFGYYYIEDLGQITVQACVRIFDAKIQVKPGGTILFDDYPNVKNPARFSIVGLGGAIIKNLTSEQYLQNTTITQPQNLVYKATNKIFAGKNVDPDVTVLDNDYTVDVTGDVELIATDEIMLTDGFSAVSGSRFYAHTALVGPSGAACNFPLSSANNQRRVGNEQKSDDDKSVIWSVPNPATSVVYLFKNQFPLQAESLMIYDSFGRNIYTKTNFNSTTDVIDVSTQPNGLYIAKVLTNGKSQQIKFVVNH